MLFCWESGGGGTLIQNKNKSKTTIGVPSSNKMEHNIQNGGRKINGKQK